MNGEIAVSEVCSDDFLNGKKTLTSSTGPRSGAFGGKSTQVSAASKNAFPRGPPGQAVRPRGAPPGQMFKSHSGVLPIPKPIRMQNVASQNPR